MRKKILFFSFILSLPFWVGVNILGQKVQDIFYWKEVSRNPDIFAADLSGSLVKKMPKPVSPFEDISLSAKSAILLKVKPSGDSEVLLQKNSSEILPIASLTKLMTAFIVFNASDNYSLNKPVLVSETAAGEFGISKYVDLKPGEVLSVENLLHVMLMESSNDAAALLAEVMGRHNFISQMNAFAKQFGVNDTFFINPTGLEDINADGTFSSNVSTANDLANFTKLILQKYPQILEISSKDSYEVMNFDGTIHHFIPQNTNELLRENMGNLKIIGGKTGYTTSAGECLISVFYNEKDASYFIGVVLGSEDRFNDMRKIVSAIEKIIK